MRIRRRTDEEERALCMPTRTVRVTVDGETMEQQMGSGTVLREQLQYSSCEEWKALMEERKAVEQ